MEITRIALFVTVNIIMSQIVIPIGLVPISMSLVGVYLSGYFLGWKQGAIAQIVYIILGSFGIPVFSSFSGGIQVLFGPTGGYIIGYVIVAMIVGWITERKSSYCYIAGSMIVGLAMCYTLGTLWLGLSTNIGIYNALLVGVFPFILGDLFKIVITAWIIGKLEKHK